MCFFWEEEPRSGGRLCTLETELVVHERFPVSVPQRFKGRALILKMLVIEPLTANMHVVNALHTKNFSLAQSNNASATDVKMAVTATFKLVAIEEIVTEATVVSICA